MALFDKHFPKMTFYKRIEKYLDIQEYYQKVCTPEEKQYASLKTAVKNLLYSDLCKEE